MIGGNETDFCRSGAEERFIRGHYKTGMNKRRFAAKTGRKAILIKVGGFMPVDHPLAS